MDKLTEKINEAIKAVRFGEVIIKIQDRRVVQIDRLEKIKIDADSKPERQKINSSSD
ncbi:MAG: DUF2292 domain-containing protein [Candidatus Omnitrophota bacterium]